MERGPLLEEEEEEGVVYSLSQNMKRAHTHTHVIDGLVHVAMFNVQCSNVDSNYDSQGKVGSKYFYLSKCLKKQSQVLVGQ